MHVPLDNVLLSVQVLILNAALIISFKVITMHNLLRAKNKIQLAPRMATAQANPPTVKNLQHTAAAIILGKVSA